MVWEEGGKGRCCFRGGEGEKGKGMGEEASSTVMCAVSVLFLVPS